MMLSTLVLVLPLLVKSSLADCGGGRWPSHVYQERTEILEGNEVLSRDNTTFEVSKNKNETLIEQISANVTTFEDTENEEAIAKSGETTTNDDRETDDNVLQNSFDSEVGDGFQSFSGITYSDNEEYYDEDEMDDWTKSHYKKIKGLTMLQNETQEIVLPQSGTLICWTNVCHEIDVIIHRVEVIAAPGFTIQCLDGGVGSYKMAFKITGPPGEQGNMSARLWGAYALGHRYIWITDGDWSYQCGESLSHC